MKRRILVWVSALCSLALAFGQSFISGSLRVWDDDRRLIGIGSIDGDEAELELLDARIDLW